MLTIKRKYFIWAMFLLLGMSYFNAVSILEINYFWKSWIAIAPIQLGSVIYITHLRCSRTKNQPKAINS
ncbi:MAG: hypothetical protein EA343_00840 [Nodularia sp. (in: Bacteria)]|nr:MAG: hypothetical protein EA343_00840 [Nodularia sp. (in: cyanobacteria)]